MSELKPIKQIVVLQRGWVVVGDVTRADEEQIVLSDASVIRYWGTTNGLGELALNGPTSKTILDAAGTVRVHPLAVVLRMDTEAALWA